MTPLRSTPIVTPDETNREQSLVPVVIQSQELSVLGAVLLTFTVKWCRKEGAID